jgi:hypothetical protein
VNDEFKRIWKEEPASYFEELSSLGGTEQNYKKP